MTAGLSSSASVRQLRFDGEVAIYRLHDAGYAISLEHAAELLGSARQRRTRPSRSEAREIQIRNPPLFVELDQDTIAIAGRARAAKLSAHLFDFGVCSLHIVVPGARDSTWEEFADFGVAIDIAGPEITSLLDRTLEALLHRISAAIERPALAPLTEDYRIFRVGRLSGLAAGETAFHVLSNDVLAPLLLGERQPLAATAQRDLLPHRFSYFADDMAVLSWENALIVEPRPEDRDIEYVLEFANAQLLELRIFDHQLDEELPALYDRIEAARRRLRLSVRFRKVLSQLQARVADITETVERVENSLRATNDVYLARIYSAALETFREREWRNGIERKLGILRDTYAMLHSEAQAARGELLEITIVLLILAELMIGLFGGR